MGLMSNIHQRIMSLTSLDSLTVQRLDNLTSASVATFNVSSDLSVGGNLNVGNTLQVYPGTAHPVYLTGETTINGPLIVTGAVTGYTGATVPGIGQLGDLQTYNTTAAKTFSTSLQTLMTNTFSRGPGVYMLSGHVRLFQAIGTTDSAVVITLTVDAANHFYYQNINTNILGVAVSHTIPFSMIFGVTSGSSFTISVNGQYSTAPSAGSITTSSSTDVRYSAIQTVRIA